MSDELRDDDNQIQIGVGAQENQIIPVVNNPPPPQTSFARRILTIPTGNEIVGVLSNLSSYYDQAIHIFSTWGNASSAILTALPSLQQLDYSDGVRFGLGAISYLNGWFLPMDLVVPTVEPRVFSRPNGMLHSGLIGIPQGISIANRIIADRGVKVYVVFICGPGSRIRPDEADAPPAQMDIPHPRPIGINPPPVPGAQRMLTIQHGQDVVSVLSELSQNYRQPIYILRGKGNVTQVRLTRIPSDQEISFAEYREILYLSGWFQPFAMNNIGWHGAFSRHNGVLNVSLSGFDDGSLPPGALVANRLMAYGAVEVHILLICGPGAVIEEADELGEIPSDLLP